MNCNGQFIITYARTTNRSSPFVWLMDVKQQSEDQASFIYGGVKVITRIIRNNGRNKEMKIEANLKVRAIIEQVMKVQRGSRGVVLLFL
jgi:hypothetical protein